MPIELLSEIQKEIANRVNLKHKELVLYVLNYVPSHEKDCKVSIAKRNYVTAKIRAHKVYKRQRDWGLYLEDEHLKELTIRLALLSSQVQQLRGEYYGTSCTCGYLNSH